MATTQVPDFVLNQLRHALARIAEYDASLESARNTDRVFNGQGRYENEWRMGYDGQGKAIAKENAEARIEYFKGLAADKGIDGNAVIAALMMDNIASEV